MSLLDLVVLLVVLCISLAVTLPVGVYFCSLAALIILRLVRGERP